MNWRSNKKFSVAFLPANVNFQKEQINCQKINKKTQKNETWTYKNPKKKFQKSSKEISVRDHSDYEKIPKKMYAIKCLIVYYKFYGNCKIF
jgi:hypothetical protein